MKYRYNLNTSLIDLQVELLRLEFYLEASLVPINEDERVVKMVLVQNASTLFTCSKLSCLYDFLRDEMGIRWMVSNGFAKENHS